MPLTKQGQGARKHTTGGARRRDERYTGVAKDGAKLKAQCVALVGEKHKKENVRHRAVGLYLRGRVIKKSESGLFGGKSGRGRLEIHQMFVQLGLRGSEKLSHHRVYTKWGVEP